MSTQSATDFDFELERVHQLASEPARKLDHTLHVRFYKHAELNSFKSKEAGRKIFEDHVYVRIQSPANRLTVIERRASDDDKLRFADQYRRFLQNEEQLTIGTPIKELPGLTASQILEFQHLKVETVEQLADISDSVANLLGTGGQSLKQAARRYLDRLANSEHLSDENRRLRMELEALQQKALAEAAAGAGKGEVKVTARG